MYKREKTCKCIENLTRDNLQFHKGREYQVDVYAHCYQIYQNGGWYDSIFITTEYEFSKYFKLIE